MECSMSISDAAINLLPLGKDVYDDLTFCMQEWENAGFEAVQAVSDPESDSSTFDWVVTLIGNLAWAATVFFPPARVAGSLIATETSVATKAVSMLGATLAADVVGKLGKLGGNLR